MGEIKLIGLCSSRSGFTKLFGEGPESKSSFVGNIGSLAIYSSFLMVCLFFSHTPLKM